MTVLTREKFSSYWNHYKPGLGDADSVLWAMERYERVHCHWFVSVDKPVIDTHMAAKKRDFWSWCNRNLQGHLLCYSSSQTEEWWGFTHKNDVILFLLKWA